MYGAMRPAIPTIDTERLRLRAHHVDDFDPYCVLWSDPDVVRYIGGSPSTREQTWSRLMRARGHWHHLGFGFLVIEEKASGRLIGEAGFHEVKRDISPSLEGSLEAGWLIAPAFHGRGFALEAMQAMIGWAETSLPVLPMTAIIHPDNHPSLRLAGKLGFREIARTDYNGETVVLRRS